MFKKEGPEEFREVQLPLRDVISFQRSSLLVGTAKKPPHLCLFVDFLKNILVHDSSSHPCSCSPATSPVSSLLFTITFMIFFHIQFSVTYHV